jgi:hypothetical protein
VSFTGHAIVLGSTRAHVAAGLLLVRLFTEELD